MNSAIASKYRHQAGARRVGVTAALLTTALAWPALADHPNIIFILADDIGTEAIEGAAWPNELNCHTPNLAQWASAGRSFTNARVYPVCSPTRAAIMSGREALRTGVAGVLWPQTSSPQRELLSLHNDERTIGEALQARGYHTILIDKWHLGWDNAAGVMPADQGFDVFHDYRDTLPLDDPLQVGDEHISLTVDLAIDAVESRPNRTDPYALFFWTLDAHERQGDGSPQNFKWWKVHSDLLPSGENYYGPGNDNPRNRYRAVVESLDTELFRLLNSLGVVDNNGNYRRNSDTIVVFLGDNGTPRQVSTFGDRAKGSLFEAGIRVPMFVFGENVPSDGRIESRLVSAVDLFETLADVADVDAGDRGAAPRDSRSFADLIGYTRSGPVREFSVSGRGHPDDPTQAQVSITDGRYKLIARGGGAMLAPLNSDQFYDLQNDPPEQRDLVRLGMNGSERARYNALRDEIVNHWPIAMNVRASNQVDIPLDDVMWIDSRDRQGTTTLTLGHLAPGDPGEVESRILARFAVDRLENLLPPGKDVSDIVRAQIAFGFARDSGDATETDTGVIAIHPMTEEWSSSGSTRWSDIVNALNGGRVLGRVDVAPHIIPNPLGSQQMGVPMPMGTPLSFGHSADLLEQVLDWHERPWTNDGVMLSVEALPNLEGDQRVFLMNRAVIRLTLQ